MRDDFSYEPREIRVRGGEAVEFRVRNEGKLDHEFLLGDERAQQKLQEAMQHGGHQMGGMGAEVPGVEVSPGQGKSFVFVAPRTGTLIYGCHVAGHYKAGMRGVLKIDG